MVLAMGYGCVIKHVTCGDARRVASEFSAVADGTLRDAILDGTAGLVAQIALFAILRKQRLRMEKFG